MMGKAFVTLKEAPCTKRVHWGFPKRFVLRFKPQD